jgi:hypothetical protein
MLESESVAITVVKPGSLTNRTLTLVVAAHGEAEFDITFDAKVTHFGTSSGALLVANRSIRVDQPSISAFGQHVEWKQRPPEATWPADLDGSRLKYTDTLRHEFVVRLACDGEDQSCAADGDVLETIISMKSQRDTRVGSRVTILTTVQSLISCEKSGAQIWQAGMLVHGNRVSAERSVTIRVQAVDVDGLNISRTRAEIEFRCGNETLPSQPWRPGSNEYVAEVPTDLLLRLGDFDLVALALNGWSQTSREEAPCDLLRVRMFATSPLTPIHLSTFESAFIGTSIVFLMSMMAGLIVRWYFLRPNVTKRLKARKIRLLHELQKKYDIDGTLAPVDRVDADGDLPIHYALECGAAHSLVRAILSKHREGAKAKDARGNLPLHLLLQGLSSQADWAEANASMCLLLAAFPEGKVELDMDRQLPIQILLQACLPAAGGCALGVELGFPLDCDSRAGNWHWLLASSPPEPTILNSHLTPVLSSDVLVEAIVKHAQETRRATIQQLAYATDSGGREAWAVATKEHRQCLWKYLLCCGRYGIQSLSCTPSAAVVATPITGTEHVWLVLHRVSDKSL